MAKYPTAGQVKRRLAVTLGAASAAALYAAFVGDLDGRLRAAGMAATWACWPPGAPFSDLVGDAPLIAQRGADLGARMAAAASEVLSRHGRPVVLLGADSPHLDLTVVAAAGAALSHGEAEVVIGPAADGGYYLLGVRRLVPELFRDVAWGTSTVLSETVARLEEARVPYRLLAPGFDVDTLDDVRRLAALVRAGSIILPRTAGVLARLGLS
jgi:hypothetical protein